MTLRIWPGSALPLGAHFDGAGVNFSIFSEVAERVDLCLFDEDGRETALTLPERTRSAGMAMCPAFGLGSDTASACSGHGGRTRGCAAIRRSCCSIRTLAPSPETS